MHVRTFMLASYFFWGGELLLGYKNIAILLMYKGIAIVFVSENDYIVVAKKT